MKKKRLATDELIAEAGKLKIIFALVQEPYYVGANKALKHYRVTRVIQMHQNRTKLVKAAIVVFDESVEIVEDPALTSENIAVALLKTGAWTLGVVSVYFEDYLPINPYIDKIKFIHGELKKRTGNIIIGGDCNAWNTWWGSEKVDIRGEELLGALHEMEMHILNEGVEPTFDTIRGGKRCKSHVDITTCSGLVLGKVREWRLDTGLISSDHNAIVLSLAMEKHLN